MNMKCQEAEDFYNAMSHCVDGYIFICRHPDSEYEVTLPEEFVEEFSLSSEYKKHYFDEWILKIHEEDREKYQNNLQSILKKRADSICIQYRVKDKNADWVWLESRVYMKRNADGEAEMLAGVIRNLRKNNQLDHITGLLNKYAFREAAEEKIKNQTAFGVLLLNIDDFKHINELYDQYFGDSVLRSIGMYVQSRLDSNASVYRLNGDEFGILITNPQENQAKNLFQRISHHYSTQKELEGKRYYCTFSATYHKHENGTGYEEFVKSLKAAMTVVKRQGKNHMEDFKPEFLQYKERELELIELLRNSVENDFEGFELNFQPQVYADSKILKGAEALLRWRCEKYGKVSPVEFIPLLERSDMIQAVGRWVFEKAVDMCRRWVYLNPEFTMSINVSYLQLFDPQFVDFMKECVKNAGIHYQNIIVEITESKFISDKELLKRVFDSVRSLGMKIAMDDFGTGYSSLGILKEAPADIVKIDKIFVRNIKDNSFDSSFIRVVVELCHQVGIKVCLEGVEEDAEMNVVSEMDLDFIQGYLYGKPEAAEQFYQMYLQAGQA